MKQTFQQPIGRKQALEKAEIIVPVNTQTLVTASDADCDYFRSLEEKGIYLDREQLEATRAITGPTLLMAGAGSGKTRVLISRVGYMLRYTDIQPNEIMLVTFTTKAANEMKERLIDLFGEEVAEQIAVGTFHSIFLRLLRSQGFKQTILSSEEFKKIILKKISVELKCDSMLAPEVILKHISGWKNQMLTFDQITPQNMMERHLMRCYERYEEWLYENNSMDFDDILLNTVNLLEYNEEIRAFMKRQFRAISIDEMQDSNIVQNRLMQLITEEDANVFFVGDPAQAIYGFRHSSMKHMLELFKTYPTIKTIYLRTNYRSNATIVGAANSILLEMLNESRVIRDQEDAVHFIRPKDVHEEARFIADVIEKQPVYKECAVLYRINTYGRAILEELVHRNLPVRMPKSDLFYEHRIIRQVLAYLRILHTPSDIVVLSDIAPTVYISKDAAYNQALSHLDPFITGFNILVPLCKPYQMDLIQKRKQLLKQIEQFEPKSAIQRIRSSFYDRFVNSAAESSAQQEAVMSMLDELETSAQRFKTITEFLSFLDELTEKVQLTDNEDGITLSTIHQAKGLEWTTVFVVGAVEKVLPHSSALSVPKADQVLTGKDALLEENRLLYVAMTRAKELLLVSSPKVYHGKPAKVSSFLTGEAYQTN